MKKITYSLFLFAFIFFSSCSEEYDDTELRNDITDLENRVQALEELCKNMNTNISSLQTLVDALQSNDYITNITNIMSGEEEIGYTIEFSHHDPITIYHGKGGDNGHDGTNGITPKLKIENNYWYISYDNGNTWERLAPAISDNVQMPKLKIENGYWHVSYDGGQTWEQLDKATGEDGQDGSTPEIGIRQDSDGNYYWTLNGEWMLDDANNKIPAQGSKGEEGESGTDGITPKLKIENGHWYVSYDNETSWVDLGLAGEVPGDSMFESVDTSNEGYVTFKLSNGTSFTIPKCEVTDIKFEQTDDILIFPNISVEIPYTLIGATENTQVTAIGSDGIKVSVTKTNATSGILTVLATEAPDMYSKVLVILTTNGQTVIRALTFEEGIINIVQDTYFVEAKGGNISISVDTNVEYSYSIEESAKEWLKPINTRNIHTDQLSFHVDPNEGNLRHATITFTDKSGKFQKQAVVTQEGNFIQIEGERATVNLDGVLNTERLEAAIIKANEQYVTHYAFIGDFSKLGINYNYNPLRQADNMETLDLSGVTNCNEIPMGAFTSGGSLVSDETLYFKKLKGVVLPKTATKIGEKAFYHCESLETINLQYIEEIDNLAFNYCKSLTEINLPQATHVEGFGYCTSLVQVILPKAISLGSNSFQYCSSLESVDIPQVTSIEGSTFYECSSLKNVNAPQATSVGINAFSQCKSLETLDLTSVTTCDDSSFLDCSSLTSISLPALTIVGEAVFYNCTSLKELNLPQVITIGRMAFKGCDQLISLKLTSNKDITIGELGLDYFPSENCALYLNENKILEVTNKNEWKGITWKSITFE